MIPVFFFNVLLHMMSMLFHVALPNSSGLCTYLGPACAATVQIRTSSRGYGNVVLN